MNTHSDQHSKTPITPILVLRWVVLFFPLALSPIAAFSSAHYALVLREDTVSPIIGAPRLLVYLSPMVTIAYLILILVVSRQQLSAFLRRGPYNSGGVLIMIPLSLLFITCGVGQTLNGMLDFSQPQNFQTTVIGSTHFAKTSYVTVQDWKNPGKSVYLRVDNAFLQYYPVGLPITITTKKGLFGYEWYLQ